MANVSRKICGVMTTLHVKMNQTKTIVNVFPACLPVRGEDASRQQMCATEKTIALTEMTKTIAVSTEVVFDSGLGSGLHSHTPRTKYQLHRANHTAFCLLWKKNCIGCEMWWNKSSEVCVLDSGSRGCSSRPLRATTLRSWASHFVLAVPLVAQVHKWVQTK